MALDNTNIEGSTNGISNDKQITLEQSLKSYRLLNTPLSLSWKQHYVNEKFSSPNLILCTMEERRRFLPRLQESSLTILDNIKFSEGPIKNFRFLIDTLTNPLNKGIDKLARKVMYSTSDGKRPIGKNAFLQWNGLQIIDMDIKDSNMALNLKQNIFESLNKYNWFLGVALSSSGSGLHIYTKIQIPETDNKDFKKKQILYLTNFRHKYSFVYLACTKYFDTLGFNNEQLLKW